MAAILSLRSQHIVRITCSRIEDTCVEHATDLRPRAQFMTRPDRTGARNQYMVHGRVNRCIAILPCSKMIPAAIKHACVMMLISLKVSQ